MVHGNTVISQVDDRKHTKLMIISSVCFYYSYTVRYIVHTFIYIYSYIHWHDRKLHQSILYMKYFNAYIMMSMLQDWISVLISCQLHCLCVCFKGWQGLCRPEGRWGSVKHTAHGFVRGSPDSTQIHTFYISLFTVQFTMCGHWILLHHLTPVTLCLGKFNFSCMKFR